MVDNLLADSIEEFLAGRCTPQRVREIEAEPAGDGARALWNEIQDSGFADALTAEAKGGAGLGLPDAAAIAMACGRHAMPLPMALTLPVRAALAASGEIPRGSITIAPASALVAKGKGPIVSIAVPYGLVADWVLLCTPSDEWLLPTVKATRQRSGGHGSVAADLQWTDLPADALRLRGPEGATPDWRATAAAFVAAQMAGAMERLLEMTITYANDRRQFGKPIGKLQAIQQQISVMAEQVYAARAAALIGLSGAAVDPLRAAIGKARAGEAAATAAAVSHAVHGAIGVTEEYDLQLYTRRLHEWRGQYGGETYWHRRLGMALIEDTVPPLEFVLKLATAATAA